MRWERVGTVLFTVLALGFLPSPSPGRAAPPQTVVPARTPTSRVLRVVDGDTVVVAIEERPVRVRLIGVDTPETVHPRKPVERFGRDASNYLKALIDGKDVRVEYESGSTHLDKYGRTLAYLYLDPGGLFVNREIVANGYGHAYTNYPFKYMDEFRAAERAAREGRVGLWGPDPATTSATLDGVAFVTRTGTKYHQSGCRYLAQGSITMPLEQASARYRPCAVCAPPPQ